MSDPRRKTASYIIEDFPILFNGQPSQKRKGKLWHFAERKMEKKRNKNPLSKLTAKRKYDIFKDNIFPRSDPQKRGLKTLAGMGQKGRKLL